jgi:hypothetical protein
MLNAILIGGVVGLLVAAVTYILLRKAQEPNVTLTVNVPRERLYRVTEAASLDEDARAAAPEWVGGRSRRGEDRPVGVSPAELKRKGKKGKK